MRPFVIGAVCLGSFLALTGCAASVGAEVNANVGAYAVPQAPETLRVRVLYTRSVTGLTCAGPYSFQLRAGGKLFTRHGATRVRAAHGRMIFDQTSFKGDIVAMPNNTIDFLKLNGRKYRGILVFHPTGGSRYDAVEYVNIEEYLYGVLPKEVDPTWPADALRAQAVVSRTYALYNKQRNSAERFDVLDGVLDQVYGGQNVEAPESNQAVDDTRGQMLADSTGKPVQAFFHSSCGGYTERPQHVWSSANDSDVFGVVSDESYCAADPHYKWQYSVSYGTIRARLRRAGIRVSEIRSISVIQKSESGRAETFGLKTSRGQVQVPGNRLRLALGPEALRSTLLVNMKAGKRSVLFEGKGWGHGVGLCQWGARGRALAGQSYKKILDVYYPKAKLVTS